MPKPNKLREFLERLREAVPLPTVLGLPVNFRGAIQCPHPNHNDTNASFNIYDHGRGHCFGAGHPGKRTLDVFDLVMLRQQLPFKLAVAEVAATAKIRLPEELINAIPERQESLERRASLTAFHDFFVQVCHQALLGEWPTRALDLIADGGRRRELTEHLQCLREDADKALHAARHHYGFSDDALASWRCASIRAASVGDSGAGGAGS